MVILYSIFAPHPFDDNLSVEVRCGIIHLWHHVVTKSFELGPYGNAVVQCNFLQGNPIWEGS